MTLKRHDRNRVSVLLLAGALVSPGAALATTAQRSGSEATTVLPSLTIPLTQSRVVRFSDLARQRVNRFEALPSVRPLIPNEHESEQGPIQGENVIGTPA